MIRRLWARVGGAGAAGPCLRLQPGADGLRRDGLHGAQAGVPGLPDGEVLPLVSVDRSARVAEPRQPAEPRPAGRRKPRASSPARSGRRPAPRRSRRRRRPPPTRGSPPSAPSRRRPRAGPAPSRRLRPSRGSSPAATPVRCGSTAAEKRRCRRTLAATMVAARQPMNHGRPGRDVAVHDPRGHDHHPVDGRRGGLVEAPPPERRTPAGGRVARSRRAPSGCAADGRSGAGSRRGPPALARRDGRDHVAGRRVAIVGPLPGQRWTTTAMSGGSSAPRPTTPRRRRRARARSSPPATAPRTDARRRPSRRGRCRARTDRPGRRAARRAAARAPCSPACRRPARAA